MNTSFFKTIVSMFGFGEKKPKKIKGEYRKQKTSLPKEGSLNADMRAVREHGAVSRRIARNVAKAIIASDKKNERIYYRKNDPKRHLSFAR